MEHKIGLEEHFAIPETIGDSLGYFPGGANDLKTKQLLDLFDMRIQEMDTYGMDMMILSLNSPAIQAIYDKQEAARICRIANEALADAIQKYPDRFRGFAALPLQDPDLACEELHYCIEELGFVGVLANGYSQIDTPDNYKYLDEPMYRQFWAEMSKLDCPFYLHPRDPMPENNHVLDGHYWIHGAPWSFGVETGSHAMRLMCSGLFDEYPNLRILLGHLGEAIPFLIWRAEHVLQRRRRGIPTQRPLTDYFQDNFWVTTSGQFYLPAMLCAMASVGTDHIMFATDYPFEKVCDACEWFDALQISPADKRKIGREAAIEFFKLDL